MGFGVDFLCGCFFSGGMQLLLFWFSFPFQFSIMILNIASANIFFPLGKMNAMVRSRTNFILLSQSCEMCSPPTGGAG